MKPVRLPAADNLTNDYSSAFPDEDALVNLIGNARGAKLLGISPPALHSKTDKCRAIEYAGEDED